jgi:hypothetical protein
VTFDVYLIETVEGEPLVARVIDRHVQVPRHLRVRRLDLEDLLTLDLEAIPERQVCDGAVTSRVTADAFKRAACRVLAKGAA